MEMLAEFALHKFTVNIDMGTVWLMYFEALFITKLPTA